MTITNRVGLGRNLTAAEVDANFATLVAADATLAAVDATKQATLTGTADVPGLTTALAAKQATLVSTTNIKSINGVSVLGTGDLTIGAGISVVNDLTTGGTTSALSAQQGVVLKTLADTKADVLSAVVLGAGPTSITRASHLNRPVSSAQASATSIVFAATATSGALAGDGFECLNTGAGTMTASGAITAASGYKLTAATGESFTCVYNSATDSFYSTTPSAAGGTFTGGTLTSAINEAPTVTIAAAGTVAIGAAAGNSVSITGTTTITAFDTIAAGAVRYLVFAGALTLTHNGTSLILPGAANISTAAGDAAIMQSLGAGNWRCVGYQKANGAAIAGGGTAYLKVLNQQFPAITCPISQTEYCLASIALPVLKAGTKIEVDMRFTLTGAGSKTIYVTIGTAAKTPGTTVKIGTDIHIASTSSSVFLRLKSGFQNMNSVSVQNGPSDVTIQDAVTSTIAPRAAAINTGSASYLNIFCDTTATDTVRLDSVLTVGIDSTGL
jgi:hypothetical protein